MARLIMPKFFTKKSLGQHFLNDRSAQQLICSQWQDVADFIIEVGPGAGALTQHLAKRSCPFFAIERDQRLQEKLEQWIKPENLFFEDALDFDWKTLLLKTEHKTNGALISNLPYNISVPLIRSFMPLTPLRYFTLMVQKEVAARILAGSVKQTGLSLLLAPFFKKKKLKDLPPGCFSPPPAVTSTIFNLERLESPILPLDKLDSWEKMLRILFSKPRKQLRNVCRNDAPQLIDGLIAQGLIEKRAENLNLEQALELFCCFKNSA